MESIISKNRKEAIERLIVESVDIAKTKGVSIEVVLKCYELTKQMDTPKRLVVSNHTESLGFFWDIVVSMIKEEEIKEGVEYRLMYNYILLRFGLVFNRYIKKCPIGTDNAIRHKDLLNSLLIRENYFIGTEKQKFKKENGEVTTTSAYKFDLSILKLAI